MVWGPGERAIAERVASAGGPRAHVSFPTTVKDVVALIEASSLLIGTDSGIAHIAAAVGTPSIVLYGSSDPRVWVSEAAECQVPLYVEGLDCLFCQRKECATHVCMERLTPERVMEEVEALRPRWSRALSGRARSRRAQPGGGPGR